MCDDNDDDEDDSCNVGCEGDYDALEALLSSPDPLGMCGSQWWVTSRPWFGGPSPRPVPP